MTPRFRHESKFLLRGLANVEPAGFPVSQETPGEYRRNLGDGVWPVGFGHRIPGGQHPPPSLIGKEISLQDDIPECGLECLKKFRTDTPNCIVPKWWALSWRTGRAMDCIINSQRVCPHMTHDAESCLKSADRYTAFNLAVERAVITPVNQCSEPCGQICRALRLIATSQRDRSQL